MKCDFFCCPGLELTGGTRLIALAITNIINWPTP
uniref:Uncharacterized protein n=1 Tax=Anguilla anguilla TaxID=7936 RepID=A0A0E9QZP8_ANGAN